MAIGASIMALALSLAAPGSEPPPFPDLLPSRVFVDGPWAKDLQATIDSLRRTFKGEIFFYVSDPWRGFRFGYRQHEPTYLASGVKIAFMVEVYRQREKGRLVFNERLEYRESDLRDGAPKLNALEFGERIRIDTLLEWMMRISDNGASDMLAKRVGLKNINRGLLEEGIYGFTPLTYLIDVRRGIYQELDGLSDLSVNQIRRILTPNRVREIRWTPIWEPQLRKIEQVTGLSGHSITKEDLWQAYDRYYARQVNSAAMASVGRLFELMCRGDLINPRTSGEMLKLMSSVRTSANRLQGALPRGTVVAHKTGSQFRRLCDLGVVTLPDGRPLVVTACTASSDVHGSERVVAALTRRAYDLVVQEHRRR